MKNRIMSLILAGVIVVSGAMAVSAEETAERAKGIKFVEDSLYSANPYTGYVGGVEVDTTVDDILSELENKNGVEIVRDKTLGASDEVQHGDKLVLKAEDGTVKSEYTIIFMGNADMNNKLNVSDASAMLKKIAKWDVVIDEIAADVDGNGAVNVSDVSTILKALAKWDVLFVNVPVLPGSMNLRATSVKQTFESAYAINTNPPINLYKGEAIGVKFTVEEGEYAISFKAVCPSWGNSFGELRFSLYKWDTDYATTVASDPVVTQKFVNWADTSETNNLEMKMTDTAGKGIGQGEYLILVHDGFDEKQEGEEAVGVGVWRDGAPSAESGMTSYFEGEVADFSFQGYIVFGK